MNAKVESIQFIEHRKNFGDVPCGLGFQQDTESTSNREMQKFGMLAGKRIIKNEKRFRNFDSECQRFALARAKSRD